MYCDSHMQYWYIVMMLSDQGHAVGLFWVYISSSMLWSCIRGGQSGRPCRNIWLPMSDYSAAHVGISGCPCRTIRLPMSDYPAAKVGLFDCPCWTTRQQCRTIWPPRSALIAEERRSWTPWRGNFIVPSRNTSLKFLWTLKGKVSITTPVL